MLDNRQMMSGSDNSESLTSPESDNYGSCGTDNSLSSTISINTKLYAKRYVILLIFIFYSMSNAFQWIEYSIIQNIITKYYNTSVFWVNSTSVVYMVCYIIGIIPATWLLERKGLRFCVLLGAFGTCVGSWIKCLSVNPDRFAITMIGQTVVAASQLFVLNIPPLLAAVWFSENEVSRATSYGVFGNQLGIALGFFIPPLVVPNFNENAHNHTTIDNMTYSAVHALDLSNSNVKEVGEGIKSLFFGVALFVSILFVIIGLFFRDKPECPPSIAQAHALIANENVSFYTSLYSLISNPNFIILFITYGLNAGVFYAVSTVLNQMVTGVYGDEYTEDAGLMGVIITISGIMGSIVCGYLLDWTRLFKQITVGIYILSLIGMIAFTGALHIQSVVWPLFFVSALLGFFMTGYLPIGFELAAEISYPQPEGTSAGLLNTAAQIFGIVFTFGGSAIVENIGHLAANICFIIALIIGSIMTAIIKADLRRQRAAKNQYNENDEKLVHRV